ncbi:MAG: guanine deaminase [Deltaproteobacteria bacterium]|nr:guanine deaminase [Deltaproteobacteria bacterium]
MTTYRARVLTPLGPDELRYYDDAIVEIEGGTILAVRAWAGEAVDEDLRPGVLTPGFVDAHVHYAQTRIIGAAAGPLLEWLETATFPEEARFADLDHAQRVASVFARSLAAAGTTLAMAWGSVHPHATDALFQIAEARGQRMMAGPVLMNDHSPADLTWEAHRSLGALDDLASRWQGRGGLMEVVVLPRFALSCTRELMAAAGALAADRGLWVSTHLSENPVEVQIAKERFGAPDYLSIYQDAGLVHEKSVYAHCIHLSDDEWGRLAAAGAVVAHCPDSNAFLGSGHMPTATVLERGIPLAVGTDVAAGRSFRVPHTLSAAWDNARAQGMMPTVAQLFWWGTRGGALALGHGELGALQPGLEADMALFEVPPWVEGGRDTARWMLFTLDGPGAMRTWVRGSEVWRREPRGLWD